MYRMKESWTENTKKKNASENTENPWEKKKDEEDR